MIVGRKIVELTMYLGIGIGISWSQILGIGIGWHQSSGIDISWNFGICTSLIFWHIALFYCFVGLIPC